VRCRALGHRLYLAGLQAVLLPGEGAEHRADCAAAAVAACRSMTAATIWLTVCSEGCCSAPRLLMTCGDQLPPAITMGCDIQVLTKQCQWDGKFAATHWLADHHQHQAPAPTSKRCHCRRQPQEGAVQPGLYTGPWPPMPACSPTHAMLTWSRHIRVNQRERRAELHVMTIMLRSQLDLAAHEPELSSGV